MGTSTFSGPVVSTNGFEGVIKVPTYTVASAPSAATAGAGTVIYVSNGAAGSPILAFSDGTNFKRSDTGATIAAS
jgi:hypothetical protein